MLSTFFVLWCTWKWILNVSQTVGGHCWQLDLLESCSLIKKNSARKIVNFLLAFTVIERYFLLKIKIARKWQMKCIFICLWLESFCLVKKLKGLKAEEFFVSKGNAVGENKGWVKYSTIFRTTLRGNVLHLERRKLVQATKAPVSTWQL